MTRKEVQTALDLHELWLSTGGEEGVRADLSYLDLQGGEFRRTDLRGADIRHSLLGDSDFIHANLQGSDLRGADLEDTSFEFADLRGAKFDINIRDCWSFEGAKFTSDALPWLILHPRWSEMKDSVQIEG